MYVGVCGYRPPREAASWALSSIGRGSSLNVPECYSFILQNRRCSVYFCDFVNAKSEIYITEVKIIASIHAIITFNCFFLLLCYPNKNAIG